MVFEIEPSVIVKLEALLKADSTSAGPILAALEQIKHDTTFIRASRSGVKFEVLGTPLFFYADFEVDRITKQKFVTVVDLKT